MTKDSDEPVPIGIEQAKALSHPLRRRMLASLRSVELSPFQLAQRLAEAPTKLYHHIKVLEQAGLIRFVRETPRRGAMERFYTATAGAFVAPKMFSPDGPDGLFASALHVGQEELRSRLDPDRTANGDEDLFMSVSTGVYADDAALRELSEFIVTWVQRNRKPGKGHPETFVSLAAFPVKGHPQSGDSSSGKP